MAKVFAHRGFSGNYPENTMLAYREAAKTGCAGIELDVQLSLDGEVVIIHDERLDRTTNGTGLVRSYTLEELQQFTANAAFDNTVPPQKIPTLREYFAFVKETDLLTNIEMKTSVYDYPGLVQKVHDLVQEYGLEDRILYSSFNHYTMQQMLAINPAAKCGLITSSWIFDIGEYAQKHGAYSVNAVHGFLSKEICDDLHRHGVLAQAWTPNTEEELSRAIENGCDLLITNYPDRALELLK